MIDCRHLSKNNETYLSHFVFALKVGLFFLLCGVTFILHAVVPWLEIPERLNLSSITRRVRGWNDYAYERLFK